MSNIIDKIYNKGLCLGCGLCESVCGKESVEMQLQDNGFFRPVVKTTVTKENEEIIENICPGINIINDISYNESQNIWGKIEKSYKGYSTDKEVRTYGSSGGMVSAIAIYTLENSLVDAVLQVGGDKEDYHRNTLKISRNKKDILECASSRYAPALIFDKIFDILNSGEETYCFIGKPCDISALKNLLNKYPNYKSRFKLYVSIVCAGIPSFGGTDSIIKEFNAHEPVKNLVYRGNGWPGYFSFIDKDEKEFQMTYNDSWGKRLGRHVHMRCKICPDGIGLQADIAVGDAWETIDGYPDFTEREGNSLIIARTKCGVEVLTAMEINGFAIYEDLKEETIAAMQPFQYKRRLRFGIRTLAVMIAKRIKVNYQNVSIIKNTMHLNVEILAKEFWGMFKRAIGNK